MKPLLCSASVVRNFLNVVPNSWPARAIDSSKPMQWQDRRIAKNMEFKDGFHRVWVGANAAHSFERLDGLNDFLRRAHTNIYSPLKVGDVLYVQETIGFFQDDPRFGILYRADYTPQTEEESGVSKWIPSIHMRKAFSRIHLEVMRVRVERACEISEEDAKAEGCDCRFGIGSDQPLKCFNQLCQSIYGPDAWEKWIWVYDLKRIK